jgi:tRNA (guanine-N7-)-methyltransferase
LVLDIGFGAGEAIMAMSSADPGTDILAVDMHTPGIGDLLASISEADITNVYVVDGDVRLLLARLPDERLSGARTFFPDPWPKKRHHRRRLINAAFAAALADKVDAGGYWHIATDWGEYADAIEEALAPSQAWRGGRIPRPDWRPQTRYERRGLAAGRSPIDLWFERVAE